ncbi:glycoside hydrolase family 43 protein [Zunongwangia endophytica]|uniref:Glycoside hydrolase family 43 protein n=1 Tax=Zunongwangia endophytica TaxID=1808945 RepID=A0ABV8H5E5_9FLAO|nr:glycoside hydrolase family 43 protein [Zunongwangia endophytica]MDN3594436.1 glycoside hydrolase family 43 protein [Zunongwangia endophytica]
MRNLNKVVAVLTLIMGFTATAQKPIIQTKYTADPAPMVYNDTIFLYNSHDEDDAEGFKMLDWLLYTSTDMVNWTEHGAVASLKDFSWAPQDNGAWAVQCIERNGKFYLYCPMHGSGIGVLVSDSPYGPFKDPLGKRLIDTDHIWNDIDPSPFIDDDGQAYLYWGNPDVYYVKLNEDMTSIEGEVVKIDSKPDNYQEGPWVWKHDDHYYLAYASTCCPEGLGYAMSDSPEGPWEYKGMIMDATEKTRGNHPGIVEYKGKSYAFGHSYDILKSKTSTFYERRSVDADEMKYNEDGTIQTIPYWNDKGPEQIESLNPFRRTEAETIAWSEGVKTKKTQDMIYLKAIEDGDYTMVQGADFKNGAKKFKVFAQPVSGGTIEIRLDGKDGQLIGSFKIEKEAGNAYNLYTTEVEKVSGVHDIYFVFKGADGELFNLDYWEFQK